MGNNNTPSRGAWGSRIGFILAAAGSAIGLGSIWKFPYMVARNGGGIFLILFLLISATLGVALMTAEMAIGSLAQRGAVGAYDRLGGKRWKIFGYLNVFCAFILLSFYSVVGGWTIAYFFKFMQGSLATSNAQELTQIFETFVADPIEPLLFHGLFMTATACVIIAGIQKGIERGCKYLMTLLFLLILILIGRVMTLPGAIDGIVLFLKPDFSKVTSEMLIDVTGLAFFSMSIGMAIMIAYGSYAGEDIPIHRTALNVVCLTVSISFLCGLMILPAITVFGIDPQAGPGLTFISMPAIFEQMSGGTLFGLLFFFLLIIAALSSSVSLLEPVTGFFVDEYNVNRTKATVIVASLMFIVGIGASLSFGIWKDYTLFGKSFFDLLDFASSNLLMPICAIAASLLVGWKIWPVFAKRLTGNKNPLWLRLMKPFCRYIAPIVIAIILIQGLN